MISKQTDTVFTKKSKTEPFHFSDYQYEYGFSGDPIVFWFTKWKCE